jgi:hypothetical protein
MLGDVIDAVTPPLPGVPKVGKTLDEGNRQLKESVPAYKKLDEGASAAGRQLGKTGETAVNDIVTTTVKAGNDIITTTVKAGNDTVIAVQKAGSDVAVTYQKGWRDTAAQAQRSFKDAVDAGGAVVRFQQRQIQGEIGAFNNAAKRVREGKVVDAVWGVAVEPGQAAEKNFAKATQESAIINVAAQTTATAYGGPAGAAAYAAWYTYRTTGDANLALKAGVLSAVTSAAGGSVANMPSSTAAEVLKKAAVTGAVGGMAVAAAGGDERAVKDAFLKSGSAVLVQGASDQLTAYAPKAQDAIQTVQCISAGDVNCLSNTTYAKDLKGQFLYDKNGKPRIESAKLDPKQYIGQWTGIDPNSAEGKNIQTITGVSKLPETQAIPIANNQWVVTWTLGQNKTLQNNIPAVVLTYVGSKAPFYSTVEYKTVPPKT